MTEDPEHAPMSLEGYWRGRETSDLEMILTDERALLRAAERSSIDTMIQICRFRIDMLECELARRRINSTVPAGLGA